MNKSSEHLAVREADSESNISDELSTSANYSFVFKKFVNNGLVQRSIEWETEHLHQNLKMLNICIRR